MIARLAHFGKLTDDQRRHQDFNYENRFGPVIRSQPGHVKSVILENESGERLAFSLWESEEALVEGGKLANAVPLLEGQRGEDIPGPIRTEVWTVIH